jgi:hypothetical protein
MIALFPYTIKNGQICEPGLVPFNPNKIGIGGEVRQKLWVEECQGLRVVNAFYIQIDGVLYGAEDFTAEDFESLLCIEKCVECSGITLGGVTITLNGDCVDFG